MRHRWRHCSSQLEGVSYNKATAELGLEEGKIATNGAQDQTSTGAKRFCLAFWTRDIGRANVASPKSHFRHVFFFSFSFKHQNRSSPSWRLGYGWRRRCATVMFENQRHFSKAV